MDGDRVSRGGAPGDAASSGGSEVAGPDGVAADTEDAGRGSRPEGSGREVAGAGSGDAGRRSGPARRRGEGSDGGPGGDGGNGSGGLLGVVLAGGRSTRFGSDKATAVVGGRTMLERGLDALRPHAATVGLVLGAEAGADGGPVRRGPGARREPAEAGVPVRRDLAPAGVSVRCDSAPDLGPLEGVRVALAWATEVGLGGTVVLACDLPLVDAGTVGALVRAFRWRGPEEPDGVVPVVEGRLQPLAAVYAVSALGVVERRLGRGERSMVGLVEELRVTRLVAGGDDMPPGRFVNVNTPEDRRRAAEALSAGPRGGGGDGDG